MLPHRPTSPPKTNTLADGRESEGFLAVEVELVDSGISHEALGLLVRLRREADRRLTDGLLDDRLVASVLAYFRTKPAQYRRVLDELCAAGVLERDENGARDVNFAVHCRTRSARHEQREQWRKWQSASRERRKSADGQADVRPDTTLSQGDVSYTPSPSPSPSPEGTPLKAPQGAGRVVALEGNYAKGYRRFVVVLSSSTGRRLRPTTDGLKKYAERRKQGYSDDDLEAAAKGVVHSGHHMGQNDRGVVYNNAFQVLKSGMLPTFIGWGKGEIRPPSANGHRREDGVAPISEDAFTTWEARA